MLQQSKRQMSYNAHISNSNYQKTSLSKISKPCITTCVQNEMVKKIFQRHYTVFMKHTLQNMLLL